MLRKNNNMYNRVAKGLAVKVPQAYESAKVLFEAKVSLPKSV